MIFGISPARGLTPIEGDDPYTTSNLGRLFGDKPTHPSLYRRRAFKSSSQYDVTVDDNDYVITTSYPVAMKTLTGSQHPPMQPGQFQGQDDMEVNQQGETSELRYQNPQYGTPLWYEKMYSKLNAISQEAFKFMQSGLSVITDFPSLHVPTDVRRTNLTRLFARFREHSQVFDPQSFDIRDEARQLLEEYISQTDLTMIPPPIVFEEQARTGYYHSIYLIQVLFHLKVQEKLLYHKQNHIQHGLLLVLHLVLNQVYLLLNQFVFQQIQVFLFLLIFHQKFKLVNMFY
jgi:hypothetical protein